MGRSFADSRPPHDGKPDAEATKARDLRASGTVNAVRSILEALIFAFTLAMFVRTFMFELFQVPTESMIPTIIGGRIAAVDWDRDGRRDIVAIPRGTEAMVFLRRDGYYEDLGPRTLPDAVLRDWIAGGIVTVEHDRIVVNKLDYWFHPPRRGDIVVFKVPPRIWHPARPIYVKRAAGLPGEVIGFSSSGRLIVDGEEARAPEIFRHLRYEGVADRGDPAFHAFDYVDYAPGRGSTVSIRSVRVPDGMIYALGDNSHASLDSRFWGGVQMDRIKGRAFFRYWPLPKIAFLD